MPGKIFYRERTKMQDGAHQPRYIVSAIADMDLKVYGQHMRMCELKFIADSLGAELIHLPRGPKHQEEEEESEKH